MSAGLFFSSLPSTIGADFTDPHRDLLSPGRSLLSLHNRMLVERTSTFGIIKPIDHRSGPDKQRKERNPDKSSEQNNHGQRQPRVIETKLKPQRIVIPL